MFVFRDMTSKMAGEPFVSAEINGWKQDQQHSEGVDRSACHLAFGSVVYNNSRNEGRSKITAVLSKFTARDAKRSTQ